MNDANGKFRIVTVGTGCAVPSLARGSSCVLLQTGGRTIVVDLGLGALHGLLKAGVGHATVDALFLSHFHTDHTAELAAFLFAANYDENPRTEPLAIFGGDGLTGYLEALEKLHGRWVAAKNYRRKEHEAKPGETFMVGPVKASAGPASHEPSSVSWRFEYAGISVVVTGDTGPDHRLSTFARGSDLLVTEASLPHDFPAPYHLRAEDAGNLAAESGAGALVLTHFYPSSEADDPAGRAAKTYPGPITAATDGAEFILPLRPS